ncbi:hypothetical protein [Wukongibacter sp. M2B1]|uniref:hypothetical protein n=1 Tax=Wukongibacter sp. M2B1 TaxID=3088895 RepID=UPI003D7A2A93
MKKMKVLIMGFVMVIALSLTACGGGISDETWNKLQDDYTQLVEMHNKVVDYCEANDLVDSMQEVLNTSADIINEAGETEREDLDKESAQAMIDDLEASIESYNGTMKVLGIEQ